MDAPFSKTLIVWWPFGKEHGEEKGIRLNDRSRQLWIQRDLFVDVVIEQDLRHHRVLDLHDVATALDIGLIGPQDSSLILRRTNKLLQAIGEGSFPLPEIERARAACRALGW